MRQATIFVGIIIVVLSLGFLTINREFLFPRKEAKAQLTKGKLLLEQNTERHIQSAIDRFTEVVARYPNSREADEALFYLAESYEKLGIRDIALRKYRKLLGSRISNHLMIKVRFKIAKLNILTSYSDEGLNGLMTLLAHTSDPHFRSEIYTELGKYYAIKHNNQRAKTNYRIALRENPYNKEAKLLLASILGYIGDSKESFSVYENYLTFNGPIDKNKRKILKKYRKQALQKGKSLLHAGKYRNSIEFFNLISKRFPHTDEAEVALYLAGNAYFKLAKYDKAMAKFRIVIHKKPYVRDESAFLKLGETYYKKKQIKKAAATFTRFLNKYPSSNSKKFAEEWLKECRESLQAKDEINNSKDEEVNTSQDDFYITKKKKEPSLLKKDVKTQVKGEDIIIEPDFTDEHILSP